MTSNSFPAIDQNPVIINLVLVVDAFVTCFVVSFSAWKHHDHVTIKGQHSSFYSIKANYS